MYFISHSSKDSEVALRIVDYLESHGVSCWIAPRNIAPGASYPSQIVKAIRECDGFILVASERINLSNHITSEIARAFDLKKRIIPFMIEKITFSDDNLYYLGQFQWVNAYNDFSTGLDELLVSIVPAPSPVNVEKKQNKTTPNGGIRVATYQELIDLGYSALQIANRLVENDYKLYPGMVVENEGNPEQWADYLSSYPETFRYLLNENNEIIGNWSFLAISEDVHAEKLAKGELTEDSFTLDETEFLLFPGDYVGYLLNLSVNEGYNSMKNINMLITAFIEQLIAFAEDGIFFKSWYVNVFRKDHEAMYRRMGFSYFLDNKTFGKVFQLSCIPYPPKSLFAMNKQLSELYYEHFI